MARRLAVIEGCTITGAVETALHEALKARTRRQDPIESAQRILAEHGLSFPPDRKPVPQSAYHDLDHDLIGEDD